jgi:hypothetical protein
MRTILLCLIFIAPSHISCANHANGVLKSETNQQHANLRQNELRATQATPTTMPLKIELIPLSASSRDLVVQRDDVQEAVKYVESVLLVNEPLLEPARSWKGDAIPSCVDILQKEGIKDDIRGITGS